MMIPFMVLFVKRDSHHSDSNFSLSFARLPPMGYQEIIKDDNIPFFAT